jgi:hypothetical protein
VDVDGRRADGGMSEIVDDVLFEKYTHEAASDCVLSEDGYDGADECAGDDGDGDDVWAMAAWHPRALLCMRLFFLCVYSFC